MAKHGAVPKDGQRVDAKARTLRTVRGKATDESPLGLDRLIHATYDLLGLQTFFTAGEKEVRAWTIPAGASAPQAAGVIHTDFE